MYTLEITESAESDLDRITDYLGVGLANPPAALALLDEIDTADEVVRVLRFFHDSEDYVNKL